MQKIRCANCKHRLSDFDLITYNNMSEPVHQVCPGTVTAYDPKEGTIIPSIPKEGVNVFGPEFEEVSGIHPVYRVKSSQVISDETMFGLPPKADMVNQPPHYTQGKVECIDALEAATMNLKGIEAVCTANAIKYLWRWKDKGGAEDLKKAIRYIEIIMEKTPAD